MALHSLSGVSRVAIPLARCNAGFRGKWVNAEDIGKTEAEIIALWNQNHPTDLIATT
jgi:hypothetical protein